MHDYFIRNLSELAQKRAVILREEAQLWDIFSRDLKREAGRTKEAQARVPVRRTLPEPPHRKVEGPEPDKLFVRVAEAARMMGMGRSSLYNEITSSKLKVRKSGRKTLIAVSDIKAWFDNLSEDRG